jgi:hypothetical protein
LKSKMVFASDSFAQRVRKMVEERVVRAASVAFRPGDWEFGKDPKHPGGINFTREHSLLEWSICNVPPNPQCLFERTDDAKTAAAIEEASARQTPKTGCGARHTGSSSSQADRGAEEPLQMTCPDDIANDAAESKDPLCARCFLLAADMVELTCAAVRSGGAADDIRVHLVSTIAVAERRLIVELILISWRAYEPTVQ